MKNTEKKMKTALVTFLLIVGPVLVTGTTTPELSEPTTSGIATPELSEPTSGNTTSELSQPTTSGITVSETAGTVTSQASEHNITSISNASPSEMSAIETTKSILTLGSTPTLTESIVTKITATAESASAAGTNSNTLTEYTTSHFKTETNKMITSLESNTSIVQEPTSRIKTTAENTTSQQTSLGFGLTITSNVSTTAQQTNEYTTESSGSVSTSAEPTKAQQTNENTGTEIISNVSTTTKQSSDSFGNVSTETQQTLSVPTPAQQTDESIRTATSSDFNTTVDQTRGNSGTAGTLNMSTDSQQAHTFPTVAEHTSESLGTAISSNFITTQQTTESAMTSNVPTAKDQTKESTGTEVTVIMSTTAQETRESLMTATLLTVSTIAQQPNGSAGTTVTSNVSAEPQQTHESFGTAASEATSDNPSSTTMASTQQTTVTTVVATGFRDLTLRLTNYNYVIDLENKNSSFYIEMEKRLNSSLWPVFRKDYGTSFLRIEVQRFRNGSLIVESLLIFANKVETPSSTDIVKTVFNNAEGVNKTVGELNLDVFRINSSGITISNLDPVMVNISFIIQDDFNSSLVDSTTPSYTALSNNTIPWLTALLQTVLNGTLITQPILNFSDNNQWIQTETQFSINTTAILNQNAILAAIVNKTNDLSYKIIKTSISVNGKAIAFDKFPIMMTLRNRTFTASLNNKSSEQFKQLSQVIEDTTRIIFAGNRVIEAIVPNYINGSVIANNTIFFSQGAMNETTVRQMLVDNVNRFSDLDVDPASIIPTGVTVSFTLKDTVYEQSLTDTSSQFYKNVSIQITTWLQAVLALHYGNSLLPDPVVNFRNESQLVHTTVRYQVNATPTANASVVLSSLLLMKDNLSLSFIQNSLNVNNVSPNFVIIQLSMRITNVVFNESLDFKSSSDYKILTGRLRDALTTILSQNELFVEVVLDRYREGSVFADFTTYWRRNISSEAVQQKIINNLNILLQNGLEIDPNSIIGIISTPSPPHSSIPTTTTPAGPEFIYDSRPFPGFAVAIIVLCGLAIICFPILAVVAWKKDVYSKLAKICELKPPNKDIHTIRWQSHDSYAF